MSKGLQNGHQGLARWTELCAASADDRLLLFDSCAQLDRMLQGLAKLLADHATGCCREQKYDNYFGRKIAIDASMHIYQALVSPCSTNMQVCTQGQTSAWQLLCRLLLVAQEIKR